MELKGYRAHEGVEVTARKPSCPCKDEIATHRNHDYVQDVFDSVVLASTTGG